ncbi:putative protein S-acyltransferase 23 [Bulinus truncatus]|nr:putative protein S-acyltransferase 23 [Bulinus truncatus]
MVNMNGLIELKFLYTLAELGNFVLRYDYLLALILIAVYGVVAVNLLAVTVYCAARNLTFNEIINRKRYHYLRNRKGEFFNPHDKGIHQNLKHYFHLGGLEWIQNITKNAFSVDHSKIYHAAVNLTTNERINYKRYSYLKDGKGAFYNPFDRGLRNNILEFLHLRPSWRDDEVTLLGVHVV